MPFAALSCRRPVDALLFSFVFIFPWSRPGLSKPPFQIQESGYGSFELVVELFFKCTAAEASYARYTYDLALNHNHQPRTLCRPERLLFRRPSSSFRRELIKGGGVSAARVKDHLLLLLSFLLSRTSVFTEPLRRTERTANRWCHLQALLERDILGLGGQGTLHNAAKSSKREFNGLDIFHISL